MELQGSRNTTTGNSQLKKCEVLTSVFVSVQISLVFSIGTTDKTLSVDVHVALMSSFYCREVPCSDERGTTSCSREDECIRSRSLQNKKTSGKKCYLIVKQFSVVAAFHPYK